MGEVKRERGEGGRKEKGERREEGERRKDGGRATASFRLAHFDIIARKRVRTGLFPKTNVFHPCN